MTNRAAGEPMRADAVEHPPPARAGPSSARTAEITGTVLALQRSIGNRATGRLLRQAVPAPATTPAPTAAPGTTPAASAAPAPGVGAPAPVAREAVVFIMGHDAHGFYSLAERYWRVHEPNATFVTDQRSLADVLSWIVSHNRPLGHVYLVSHANENGTLSFGVDSNDQDHHMTFAELNEALNPSGGGTSMLPQLGNQVDASTTVDIKGCDIGRSTDMLDLLRQAFGGSASVFAPTHEQQYGFEGGPADAARRHVAAQVRADAEAHNPMPPRIDPQLRGADRRDAIRDRDRAVHARNHAVNREIASRQSEIDAAAEAAGAYEAFSGPEIEQPGTARIAHAEVAAEVNRLYGHLSQAQRDQLIAEMERGEAVETLRPYTETLIVPRTAAQVLATWGQLLVDNHATLLAVHAPARSGTNNSHMDVVVDVRIHEPPDPDRDSTMTLSSDTADDASIISSGRDLVSNPDHYSWDVTETQVPGAVRRTARGRRMRAYLHHRSLDAAPGQHFDVSDETNPDFFGSSTP